MKRAAGILLAGAGQALGVTGFILETVGDALIDLGRSLSGRG